MQSIAARHVKKKPSNMQFKVQIIHWATMF